MNDEDEHEPEHEDDEEEDEELELMMMMMMGTHWVLNGLARILCGTYVPPKTVI